MAYFHYRCNTLGLVPQSRGWISETMERIRKKHKINFVAAASWCTYCRDFEELCEKEDLTPKKQRRFEECLVHFTVMKQQKAQYKADLAALKAGTSKFKEVFHMDFSQIQEDNCVFINDMILVVYQRDLNTGELHHFYQHYVAETTDINNDTGFMKCALDKTLDGKLNIVVLV